MKAVLFTLCFLAIFSMSNGLGKSHMQVANTSIINKTIDNFGSTLTHPVINGNRVLLPFNSQATAPAPTIINDAVMKTKLLGKHRVSLQWVSWDYFGQATVIDDQGLLRLTGKQQSRKGDDYLTIEGIINSVDTRSFLFEGKIISKVSHINNGQPCLREGKFTFQITNNRPYWRLKEMENPCEQVVDYIDIYFRKEEAIPNKPLLKEQRPLVKKQQ
jgi:hypothetical protein